MGESAFRANVFRACATQGTEGRVGKSHLYFFGGKEGRKGRQRRGGREEREGSGWGGGERRRERAAPLSGPLGGKTNTSSTIVANRWKQRPPCHTRKKKWSVKDWYFGVGITNFFRV